jgi:predicted aldo/keto reductase-like oxidoreductase
MTQSPKTTISRRSFLQTSSVLGGSALLACHTATAAPSATNTLPRRVLGRTQQEVSLLALGTWPSGKCAAIDVPAIGRIVDEALDQGINYFDCARAYDNAEEGLGEAFRKKRDQIFLTTKVWADTAEEAQASFEESLRLLHTDYVDALFIHSGGNREVDKVLAPGGSLEYLVKQKKAGKARFLGLSGHSKPLNFVPLLETDEIDILMPAMNFVDRHTYGFEDKVLPVARKHKCGIACMKVFGGLKGGFGVATGPNPGPEMPGNLLRQAVRYAMELPGVATLVIGVHTVEQLRQNAELVRNYEPLTDAEKAQLAELGRQLAPQWGPHYGPVA